MSLFQNKFLKIRNIVRQNKLLMFVFFCCFIYWGYLFRSSSMVIQFDAVGYEELGTMIYREGWEAFLRTGPHREPLYPWLVATSMHIADTTGTPYQSIQKFFQVAILFTTQLMLMALLKVAGIRDGIIAVTILYFGFSPAIVNSALSLYSEIAAYPAVLAIVWGGWYCWRAVHREKTSRVIAGAAFTALAFAWATFVKGIFQYVFLLFIIPFVLTTIEAVLKRNFKKMFNGIIFLVIAVVTLGSLVISYRYANKRLNGNLEFSNRYDGNLFGTAAKRTGKLSSELFLAHLASVPGGGVCRVFFSKETCQYCEFFGMDLYRATELPPLLKENGVETLGAERTHEIISLAFKKIADNPLQYFFLTALESLKMAFWESTQIGFVTYPEPLKRLFHFSPFKNGIRFVLVALTYFSLFHLIVRTYRRRSELFIFDARKGVKIQIEFFVLLTIVSFTALYAPFSILTRFALPITTLYLLCIAFTLQDFLGEKKMILLQKK